MGRLFGTDGIRGIANQTSPVSWPPSWDGQRRKCLRISQITIPRCSLEKIPASSDMLENAMAAGLCSIGASVVTLGVVPTLQ